MGKRNKAKIYELEIKKYSDECRGIAEYNGKVIFVRGALVGEKVLAKIYKSRSKFDEANVIEVINPSAKRIQAKCQFYGVCGGCSLQHLSSEDQIIIKLQLIKQMFLQADIKVKQWTYPLISDNWGYRRKARIGVRFVAKKNKVLVGFRELNSSFLAEMNSCEVLHPSIGKKLNILAQCVEKLSIKTKIAQFEVAISEQDSVLILRHLEELSDNDKLILKEYAKELKIKWYLQSGGLDTIKPLDDIATLNYHHTKHNITINFLASDFTQINFNINKKMVNLAIELLNLNNNDNVLDLFCGLGNFTLPFARYANTVVGVDVDKDLIIRAKYNAKQNDITNANFYQANLFEDVSAMEFIRNKQYNKALIDPARSGAFEVITLLPILKVEKLVYVSCNAATLVRDAKKLNKLGYELSKATIIDMFSHTSHVELIALFIKI